MRWYDNLHVEHSKCQQYMDLKRAALLLVCHLTQAIESSTYAMNAQNLHAGLVETTLD